MIYNIKSRNRMAVIILLMFATMILSACGNEHREEYYGDIHLYFVDNNQTNLVTMTYGIKSETISEQVKEVLEQMNKKSKKINYLPAIPDQVHVLSTNVTDKILYVDFDAGYLQMRIVEELLCRSAIVLTMSQLNGIDYVIFTVNQQPLTDASGNPRGSMKASDFVGESGSSINAYQEKKAVLYYANESGDGLVAEEYTGLYAQNTPVEKFIIERLMKSPSSHSLKSPLPSNLKLISVTTKDGICYVNFDSTFLEEALGVTPEVQLYSVVNSLVELPYVNKVQISINGETDRKFRDYVSLRDAFNRNLDLIE
ncbi:MAG: GerMN domain-containing protein [Lachnospiraceae bacterium]|nr:GerMN domain-containing protein [Lachnospiraceae bacterium]